GRCGPLARSSHAREDPRRTLGAGGAPGPDSGEEHAGPAGALRRRTGLLEPALRRDDQIRRARRTLGGRSRRRAAGGARCGCQLSARRPPARGGHRLARSRMPESRSRAGGCVTPRDEQKLDETLDETLSAAVTDNRNARRFELTVDGQVAVLNYERT